MNKNDILARLQAGENAQAIADEMAKMLNDANAEYETAKRAEADKKADKEAAANLIVDAILDYINIVDPDLCAKLDEADLDTAEVMTALDQIIEMLSALKGLTDLLEKPADKPAKVTVKRANPDKVINDFLNSIGL